MVLVRQDMSHETYEAHLCSFLGIVLWATVFVWASFMLVVFQHLIKWL